MKLSNRCEKCSDGEGAKAIVLFFLVVLIVAAFPKLVSTWYERVYPGSPWPGWGFLSDFIQKRSTKSRIALGFVQVLTRLGMAFNFTLPPSVRDFFRSLTILEIFDVFAVGSATMNCVGDEPVNYLRKIQFQTVGALAVVLLLGSAWAVHKKIRSLITDFFLIFTFVIYPSMMTLLFTWFGCSAYEDGREYLTVDTSILCKTTSYDFWSPIVGIFIVIFTVGIPSFYLLMLWPVRKIVKPKTKPGLTKLDKEKEQLRLRDEMSAKHKAIDAFFEAKSAEEKEEALEIKVLPLFEKTLSDGEGDEGKEAGRVVGIQSITGPSQNAVVSPVMELPSTSEFVAETLRGLHTEAEVTEAPQDPQLLKQRMQLLRALVTTQRTERMSHKQLVKQYLREERAMQMAFLWAGYKPRYWYLEIVEMVRKFLLTGVPLILTTYGGNDAITNLYGTLVVGLSAMLYSGNDAYRAAADRYLMMPTQFVLLVTMSTGGFEVPQDIMGPLILTVCVPTLVVLAVSLVFPDFVNRMFSGSPKLLLKHLLVGALATKGLDWVDVEPLLEKLNIDEIRDSFDQDGISGVLRLVLAKGGDGAKKLGLTVAKTLLAPIANKFGIDADSVQAVLDRLPMEELEMAFTDPLEFITLMSNKLARMTLKPVLEPMLKKKGFDFDYVLPLLDNIDSLEDIQVLIADPSSFFETLSTEDPTAARMLAIMALQEGLEPAVQELDGSIKWHEAVSVMTREELVPMEGLEVAKEDPADLLALVEENVPMFRRKVHKLRSQNKALRAFGSYKIDGGTGGVRAKDKSNRSMVALGTSFGAFINLGGFTGGAAARSNRITPSYVDANAEAEADTVEAEN